MPLSISRDPKRTCDSCGKPRDCFYISIGDKSNARKFRICQTCMHTLNTAYVQIVTDPETDSVERYT